MKTIKYLVLVLIFSFGLQSTAQENKRNLAERFQLIDVDGNDLITSRELIKYYEGKTNKKGEAVDAELMFYGLDRDNNSIITSREYAKGVDWEAAGQHKVIKRRSAISSNDLGTPSKNYYANQAERFQLIDVDGNDLITSREFIKYHEGKMNKNGKAVDTELMFNGLDRDNNSIITSREYAKGAAWEAAEIEAQQQEARRLAEIEGQQERERLAEERRQKDLDAAQQREATRLVEVAQKEKERQALELEKKRKESERLVEEQRQGEQLKLEKEKSEATRLAEVEQKEKEHQALELEKKRKESERLAEEQRQAEQLKLEQEKAEATRLAEIEQKEKERQALELEKKRKESERLAEEQRRAEQLKLEKEKAEATRLAEVEQKEKERQALELENQRKESERLAEEQRQAGQLKLEQEKAEAKRLAEEARKDVERLAEQKRELELKVKGESKEELAISKRTYIIIKGNEWDKRMFKDLKEFLIFDFEASDIDVRTVIYDNNDNVSPSKVWSSLKQKFGNVVLLEQAGYNDLGESELHIRFLKQGDDTWRELGIDKCNLGSDKELDRFSKRLTKLHLEEFQKQEQQFEEKRNVQLATAIQQRELEKLNAFVIIRGKEEDKKQFEDLEDHIEFNFMFARVKLKTVIFNKDRSTNLDNILPILSEENNVIILIDQIEYVRDNASKYQISTINRQIDTNWKEASSHSYNLNIRADLKQFSKKITETL